MSNEEAREQALAVLNGILCTGTNDEKCQAAAVILECCPESEEYKRASALNKAATVLSLRKATGGSTIGS